MNPCTLIIPFIYNKTLYFRGEECKKHFNKCTVALPPLGPMETVIFWEGRKQIAQLACSGTAPLPLIFILDSTAARGPQNSAFHRRFHISEKRFKAQSRCRLTPRRRRLLFFHLLPPLSLEQTKSFFLFCFFFRLCRIQSQDFKNKR